MASGDLQATSSNVLVLRVDVNFCFSAPFQICIFVYRVIYLNKHPCQIFKLLAAMLPEEKKNKAPSTSSSSSSPLLLQPTPTAMKKFFFQGGDFDPEVVIKQVAIFQGGGIDRENVVESRGPVCCCWLSLTYSLWRSLCCQRLLWSLRGAFSLTEACTVLQLPFEFPVWLTQGFPT